MLQYYDVGWDPIWLHGFVWLIPYMLVHHVKGII
eukprot:SAG31_NODE_37671_length_302_cov_0.891626_1_plen_33_part_10